MLEINKKDNLVKKKKEEEEKEKERNTNSQLTHQKVFTQESKK